MGGKTTSFAEDFYTNYKALLAAGALFLLGGSAVLAALPWFGVFGQMETNAQRIGKLDQRVTSNRQMINAIKKTQQDKNDLFRVALCFSELINNKAVIAQLDCKKYTGSPSGQRR